MPTPPADPAAQLQWLVDRAQISDLLVEFARSLDERDFDANTALYLPDGVFSAGPAFTLRGHAELARTGTAAGLGRYRGTWHLSANHAIDIDGDTARTRSYLIGVHLLDGDTFRHADGAGWYDCTLQRTAQGWRFRTVHVHEVWHAGEPLPHVPRPTPPTPGGGGGDGRGDGAQSRGYAANESTTKVPEPAAPPT